jgi:hypothetical protein
MREPAPVEVWRVDLGLAAESQVKAREKVLNSGMAVAD